MKYDKYILIALPIVLIFSAAMIYRSEPARTVGAELTPDVVIQEKPLAESRPDVVIQEKLLASSSPSTFSSVAALVAAENAYKQANGKYLAVIDGQTTDQKFNGKKPSDFIGKDLPPNYSIVEYETADGQVGFDLVYETETEVISYGIVGPQAAQRTFTRTKIKGANPHNGL